VASFASPRHWRISRREDEAKRLSHEPGDLLHRASLFISRGVLVNRNLSVSFAYLCMRFKRQPIPVELSRYARFYVLPGGGQSKYSIFVLSP